jgi:hypothetical protein
MTKKIKTKEIFNKSKVKIEDKSIYAIANYLRSIGWSCLVGGFKGIGQTGKYKFDLIFSFVGSKKLKK